jgi:hypothetical protein
MRGNEKVARRFPRCKRLLNQPSATKYPVLALIGPAAVQNEVVVGNQHIARLPIERHYLGVDVRADKRGVHVMQRRTMAVGRVHRKLRLGQTSCQSHAPRRLQARGVAILGLRYPRALSVAELAVPSELSESGNYSIGGYDLAQHVG